MAETESAPAAAEVPAVDPTQPPSKENELTYEFEEYKNHFFENFSKIKDRKVFNDGSLVCISGEKRVRFPCSISAISIAIPKLNREFYGAKKKMMESGFMHNSIDLELPDYRQEGTSSAETALRIILQFVFQGKFNVSVMSLKNVAVLAAFLQIDSILDALPAAAEKLGVSDFDIEEYKTIASKLGGTSVVGLEKFISVFGGGAKKKNKNQAGQKRTAGKNNAQGTKKGEPEQKKSRPLEEPNPHDNSYEIKDEVPSEEMVSEEAEKTTAVEEVAAPADEPAKAAEDPESTDSFHVSNHPEGSAEEFSIMESEGSQEQTSEAPTEEAKDEPEQAAEEEAATKPTQNRGKPAPRGRKAKRGRKAAN